MTQGAAPDYLEVQAAMALLVFLDIRILIIMLGSSFYRTRYRYTRSSLVGSYRRY
jgi:hypothetical protein